eukprot:gi/632983365/ref/XP_007908611.1/ PREDICTED: early nodulin-75-like [Callorhinchus milii]
MSVFTQLIESPQGKPRPPAHQAPIHSHTVPEPQPPHTGPQAQERSPHLTDPATSPRSQPSVSVPTPSHEPHKTITIRQAPGPNP